MWVRYGFQFLLKVQNDTFNLLKLEFHIIRSVFLLGLQFWSVDAALERERTGVCEMTVKRTRLCYWIARPAKPGVQSSNTSRVRFTVISHTPKRCRFYHIKYCVQKELGWHLPKNLKQQSYLFFMPPPLGAGGIMFSGCPSVRPSVRPKPEIPSFDLYMGPLVHPTNRNRFTVCPSVRLSVRPSGEVSGHLPEIIALWGWFSRDVLPVTCCEHGPPSIATVHFSNFSIATNILFN